MTQDQNNQMTLSEEQGIQQVNEQELQAIAGGCDQCREIRDIASTRASGSSGSLKTQWETLKSDAAASTNKEPKGRLGVCEDCAKLSSRLVSLRGY